MDKQNQNIAKKAFSVSCTSGFAYPPEPVFSTLDAIRRGLPHCTVSMDADGVISEITPFDPKGDIPHPEALGCRMCDGWTVVVWAGTANLALGHNRHDVVVAWDNDTLYVEADNLPSEVLWSDFDPAIDTEVNKPLSDERVLERGMALLRRLGVDPRVVAGKAAIHGIP